MPKNKISSDIRAIQRSLHTLDRALRLFTISVRNLAKDGAAPPRRKLTLSPSRRAALKLQGRYMGYLRQLTARQKAEVRTLRVRKGTPKAIARARQLAARWVLPRPDEVEATALDREVGFGAPFVVDSSPVLA